MSAKIFPKGLQAFADNLDWDSNTIRAVLVAAITSTRLKLITGVTNASPAVLTATGHGLSVDDVVVVGEVGGCLSVNGLYRVASTPNGNTFTLKTLEDGLAVSGSGAYTSGGFVINLSAAQFRSALVESLVGTPQELVNKSLTNGELDANDVTFTGVTDPGAKVVGVLCYEDSGNPATDRNIVWHDGRVHVVVAADAAQGATTIWVERLAGPIPSGTVLTFSNGQSATLSAAAAAGARALSVNALANSIGAGHTADAPTTGNNLPVQPNGGNIAITWGAYIAKL